MGNDVAEVVQPLPCSDVKVHRLMCMELMKFVDRISQVFPDIESARPRCTLGIEALCSINLAMEKAKLLIQHCSESSRLYLAITGEAILARFTRVHNELERSLSHIEDMVPILLAAQISGIVDDLRVAKFTLESSEEEAGRVLLALIRKDISTSDSMEPSEIEAFQFTAARLQLTSPKSLLIERRAIKKLIDKFHDTEKTKERILKYLLYLVKKYGKSYGGEQMENASSDQCESSLTSTDHVRKHVVCSQSIEKKIDAKYGHYKSQTDTSCTAIPPEEFRCPISSRLMHDPVIIASGQTFERVWIEKWFNEGNDTCPKTQKKLQHFSMTPNSALKDLISKWCKRNGITIPNLRSQPIPAALNPWKTSSSNSIASLGSSLNDVHLRIDVSTVSIDSSDASYFFDPSNVKIRDGSSFVSSQMNGNSHECQSFDSFSSGENSVWLSKLAALPWTSQCKAVEDIRNHFNDNDQACYSLLSDSSIDSLFRFLKYAHDVSDAKAQRDGVQVLLAFLRKSSEIPSLSEEMFHLLAVFLESEVTKEALAIIEVLSSHQYWNSKIVMSGALPSILNILDNQVRELHAPAARILYNLTLNRDIGSRVISMGCIWKFIPLLGDSSLAGYCIKILSNLCEIEAGRVAIAETNGCLTSITELLETESQEEQEHAVAVLLFLCSQRTEYCQLVMDEGIIPSLVNISVNGNIRGKESAMELLRILRDVRYDNPLESSLPHPGPIPEFSQDPCKCSKEKKPSSKVRFLGGIRTLFSKRRTVALS